MITLSSLSPRSLGYHSLAIGFLGIILIVPAAILLMMTHYLSGVLVLAMAIFLGHVADLFRNEARQQRTG